MASANRFDLKSRGCRRLLLRVVLTTVPVICSVFFFSITFSAGLFAQNAAPGSAANSNSGSSESQSSQSQSQQFQSSSIPTSQVQTSAQNPVYGSVPEAKPTPGVLQLTFKDAIERALRQNLAGLLSEYNTIQARGEKWQKLSDLLPNINADVQEAREKVSLEAEGL